MWKTNIENIETKVQAKTNGITKSVESFGSFRESGGQDSTVFHENRSLWLHAGMSFAFRNHVAAVRVEHTNLLVLYSTGN